MLRKTVPACAAAIAASLLFAGCTKEMKQEFKQTEQFQGSRYDYGTRMENDDKLAGGARAYGYTIQGLADHHDNKRMVLDLETGNAVSSIDGVAVGYVVVTDRNAYVGLMLDSTATGGFGVGNSNRVNNHGTSEGVYDARTGSPYADWRNVANDVNSYYTAPDHRAVSDELKQVVAEKVRLKNPHVLEVFISANQGFVNTLNRLAIQKWTNEGGVSERKMQQFNDMVRKHFRYDDKPQNLERD